MEALLLGCIACAQQLYGVRAYGTSAARCGEPLGLDCALAPHMAHSIRPQTAHLPEDEFSFRIGLVRNAHLIVPSANLHSLPTCQSVRVSQCAAENACWQQWGHAMGPALNLQSNPRQQARTTQAKHTFSP